jgi:hypothetical protein
MDTVPTARRRHRRIVGMNCESRYYPTEGDSMANRRFISRLFFYILLLSLSGAAVQAVEPAAIATIDWGKIVRVSRTTPTLQVVVNPMLRRGASMHDAAFRTLHE